MSLRLNSGFCHGLVLKSPAAATRPTSGRVRAAVWNSLQDQLEGARVLDLFAGSGAIGIEALSRGAKAATFVENNQEALRSLKLNLNAVRERALKQDLQIEIQVHANEAVKALATCPPASFDILYLDPPYALLTDLLDKLGDGLRRVRASGALLVVESHADALEALRASPGWAKDWELDRQKVYGKIGVSFFTSRTETIL